MYIKPPAAVTGVSLEQLPPIRGGPLSRVWLLAPHHEHLDLIISHHWKQVGSYHFPYHLLSFRSYHFPPLETGALYTPINLIKSSRNQIVFTIFPIYYGLI